MGPSKKATAQTAVRQPSAGGTKHMAELLQCIKSCDLYAEDAAECLADACSAACTVVRSHHFSIMACGMLAYSPESHNM